MRIKHFQSIKGAFYGHKTYPKINTTLAFLKLITIKCLQCALQVSFIKKIFSHWSSFVIVHQNQEKPTILTFGYSHKDMSITYPEILPLSTLIACNAMNWPGGAAIYLSHKFQHWLILYTLGQYIVNVQWSMASEGFLTIFKFGIRKEKISPLFH